MSVTVIVELKVKEDQFDSARDIFKNALEATRAWKGCNSIEVFSNKEEAKYTFIEDFESEQSYNEYFEWRIKESGELLSELLREPLQKSFHKTEQFGYGKN